MFANLLIFLILFNKVLGDYNPNYNELKLHEKINSLQLRVNRLEEMETKKTQEIEDLVLKLNQQGEEIAALIENMFNITSKVTKNIQNNEELFNNLEEIKTETYLCKANIEEITEMITVPGSCIEIAMAGNNVSNEFMIGSI